MSANTELFLRGADTLTRGNDAIVPKLVSFELFELDYSTRGTLTTKRCWL
jgi:hypothetical protein